MDAIITALSDPQAWMALLTLTLLEIVLGIDNIVFISILAGKLPKHQQERARVVGLSLAMITRILLLLFISWIMKLTKPLFEPFGHAISGKDIILIAGGLFLIAKATHEIHGKLEGDDEQANSSGKKVGATYFSVISQILLVDIIFSLDSVVTAIGMARELWVMITAVIISVIVMLLFSGVFSRFVERHPTVKILALSFLVLIGANLVADGFGHHIPKGYTYFAMAFSMLVEMINLKLRKSQTKPVHLRTNAP